MTRVRPQLDRTAAAPDATRAGVALASLAFLLLPLSLLMLRGLEHAALSNAALLMAAALVIWNLLRPYLFTSPSEGKVGSALPLPSGEVPVRGVRVETIYARLGPAWPDLALILLAAFAFALAGRVAPESAGALRQAIAEVYVAFAALRCVRWRGLLSIHPAALIAGAFVAIILIGAALLCLPAAVQQNTGRMYFIDALFTSTSALCATCLPLRDTARDFTTFGQTVILGLVQTGGYLFMLFGSALAVRVGRRLLGEGDSQSPRATLAGLAWPVAAVMLAAEALGTLGLCSMFYNNWDWAQDPMGAARTLWYAAFHSVSAFCNAGFTLYTDSMSWFRDEWQVLGLLMPLTILGGLGYPVLEELGRPVKRFAQKFLSRKTADAAPQAVELPHRAISRQTRMTLGATWMLIVFGALVMMLLENAALNKNLVERAAIKSDDYVAQANWSTMTQGQRLRESLVQSVAARSSGLRTLSMEQLSDGGKMTLCTLMLAGGGQGGTAGGVKLPLAMLLVAAVGAGLRRQRKERGHQGPGSPSTEAESAPGPFPKGQAAVTVVSLYLLLVAVTTLLLCVSIGSRGQFMDAVFEAISACGSVGWSTGLTPTLGVLGKSTLIAAMLLGRLGPALLLWRLTGARRSGENGVG